MRRTDLGANRGRTDLWLVGLDGGGLRRLTSNPSSDFNARWAPDGKQILFLSSRSGSAQVWRIAVDGGEAVQVSDLPLDIGSLAVSPDGKKLAVSIDVFPDCTTVACTRERLDANEESKTTGRIFERLFIRHWDHWKDGRRSSIKEVVVRPLWRFVRSYFVQLGILDGLHGFVFCCFQALGTFVKWSVLWGWKLTGEPTLPEFDDSEETWKAPREGDDASHVARSERR